MDEWGQFISQYGFPVVVAGFLLFRLDKSFQRLTGAVEDAIKLIKAGGK